MKMVDYVKKLYKEDVNILLASTDYENMFVGTIVKLLPYETKTRVAYIYSDGEVLVLYSSGGSITTATFNGECDRWHKLNFTLSANERLDKLLHEGKFEEFYKELKKFGEEINNE